MDDEAALNDVIALCGDEDRGARGRAINATLQIALSHDRMEEASRELSRQIDRIEGPAKADLVMALGKLTSAESVRHLMSLLNDGDPAVRLQAVRGLGLGTGMDSGDALLTQLDRESDTAVRLELLLAVQKRRLLGAVDPVIPWTADRAAEIQKAAAKTLTSLTGQSFGTDYDRWAGWWAKARPRN
jgi:HEAT repeat protein